MLRFPRLSTLLVALLAVVMVPTGASAAPLVGQWQQLGSNAGFCGDCTITVQPGVYPGGQTLVVTASNGWQAEVQAPQNELYKANGFGCWCSVRSGPYAGKPFALSIDRKGSELVLVMQATDGSFPAIQVLFGREALLLRSRPHRHLRHH